MRMCVIVYTNACMHTCKFAVKYLFLIFPFPWLFFLITIFVACSFYASFLLLIRMKASHWPFNIFFSPSLFLYFPYLISFRMTSENLLFFSSTICFLSLNILFLLFSVLPFILNFLPCIFHWFFWITFFISFLQLFCMLIYCVSSYDLFLIYIFILLKILIECYMF